MFHLFFRLIYRWIQAIFIIHFQITSTDLNSIFLIESTVRYLIATEAGFVHIIRTRVQVKRKYLRPFLLATIIVLYSFRFLRDARASHLYQLWPRRIRVGRPASSGKIELLLSLKHWRGYWSPFVTVRYWKIKYTKSINKKIGGHKHERRIIRVGGCTARAICLKNDERSHICAISVY